MVKRIDCFLNFRGVAEHGPDVICPESTTSTGSSTSTPSPAVVFLRRATPYKGYGHTSTSQIYIVFTVYAFFSKKET